MSINPDLKVIIDFGIKDSINNKQDYYRVRVPIDMKELLFNNKDEVISYINTLGHKVVTNIPDDNAWHGWDIPDNRKHLYPDKLSSGRDHSNYQLMNITPNTLTIDVNLETNNGK